MFLPLFYLVPWLKPAVHNPYYLKEFLVTYDIQYSEWGDPAGRIPSTIKTFRTLANDPPRLLLGYGPGAMLKSYFQQFDTRALAIQPIWIEYGITEFVLRTVESGFLGFISYFLLPIFLLFRINERFYRKIRDNYWKSISLGFSGIIFSFFILGVGYSLISRGDLAAFIFWFFAATIHAVGRHRKIF
jgi:hypothetical protein